MTFCPPGFRYLDEVRDQVGYDELRGKLMAGEWNAYEWWQTSSRAPSPWKGPLRHIEAAAWWDDSDAAYAINKGRWGGATILLSVEGVPELSGPARATPPIAVSEANVRKHALKYADGKRSEAEVRATLEKPVPERVWRQAWQGVPKAQKLTRGRRKNPTQKSDAIIRR